MTTTAHVDKVVQYPSKWDIVPVHNSDRSAFKTCRRRWGWSSPSKQNLVPRTQVYGIAEPLWFGTGIHHALQGYYDPALREDPATTWLAWFDLQWEGGYVTEAEVAQFVDREPQRVQSTNSDYPMYRVSGLRDVLPYVDNETEEKFAEFRALGEGMMKFYKLYAEAYDNFDVIAVEHEFSVPILNPSTGEALYIIDTRVMPDGWQPNLTDGNIFGPLMHETSGGIIKQVHARGRQDIIVRDREYGLYKIRDYKTAKSVDEDYFRHLELDEQCTTYLWAGEIEAKMFDLEYKDLQAIDYVALFKGYPRAPTITSRGLPSINRKDESTTARLFEQTIDVMGIRPIFEHDEKMQAYYQWLLEIGDKRFIWPKEERRNPFQRKNAGIRVFYEAMDMLNPEIALYPNIRKEYDCLNCRFRVPCIAAETGADYLSIIEDGYVPNWDR